MLARLILASVVFAEISARCTGGIPSAEVQSVVAIHNTLRKKIALGMYTAKGKKMPAAAVAIPLLTYNCEIEANAQAWCNNCVWGHSTKESRPGMGENLYQSSSTAPLTFDGMGKKASDAWEKEFQDFGWATINLTQATFDTGIGHATQMAWSGSTEIGCGMTQCPGTAPFLYKVFVCCQYKAAGNMLNRNIYEPKP